MENKEDLKPCNATETSELFGKDQKYCEVSATDPTATDRNTKDPLEVEAANSKESSVDDEKSSSATHEGFVAPAPVPIKFQKPFKKKPKSQDLLCSNDPSKKQANDKSLNPNASNIDIKANEKSENQNKKESKAKVHPKHDTKPKAASIELPYREPSWGGKPEAPYSLEVIKDGMLKDTFPIDSKSFYTFGRLEECDMTVDHPSCSRYHAVLQFCAADSEKKKKGFYLYDLGSTHGTKLNKDKLQSRTFYHVRVGHVIKFGGSSRLWIVQGPEEDQEDELDIVEVRKKQQEHRASVKISSSGPINDDLKREDADGISWGFGEDAVEEHLNLQDLLDKKRNIEVKDPKKYLRNFFESEGLEFEYELEEKNVGRGVTHVAKVSLPIETSTSDEVIAEGSGPSKKEAVLACATDACRLLEAYDALNKISREDHNKKRQRELEANDYYDSDDDSFLDRTGSVEKKRLKRMKYAGKQNETKPDVETHESLLKKMIEMEKEMSELNQKLRLAKKSQENASDDTDSLDAYMSSMAHSLDGCKQKKWKARLAELKKDADRTQKLIQLTKPALPSVSQSRKQAEHHNKDKKKDINQPSSNTTPTQPSVESDMKITKSNSSAKESVKRAIPSIPESKKQPSEETILQQKVTPKVQKTKVYGPSKPPSSKEDDADYAAWLPPEGQTGDGKTHLNEKFGY